MSDAAQQDGLPLGPLLPEGLEVAVRGKSSQKFLFLLNYTEKAHKVTLQEKYRSAIDGQEEPMETEVPPFGVKVLVTP